MSNSTIADAVINVNALDFTKFPEEVPCMQAANFAIKYDINYDTNNADSNGFRLVQSIHKEEAIVHGQLHDLLRAGKEYVIMLYTWRSCSRAIPSGDDPETNMNIRKKTVEILESSIKKLREFRVFSINIADRFCEEVDKLCRKRERGEYLSEAYMIAMINLLKIIVLLDEMKNMKASMKNDHTLFKRAAELLQNHDQSDTENTMFLAEQNKIRRHLKDKLIKIHKFDEFIVDLIRLCVTMYQNKQYIFPEEKHTFVLVIGFSLFLLDTKTDSVVVNINKIKKINISTIDQIFKECQVVNVFGDMSIYPFRMVDITPHFEKNKWPENMSIKPSSQGVLLDHINQFRSEYVSLTAELARYSNDYTINQSDESSDRLKFGYDLGLKAIQLLSKWTTQIIDTFSWKLGHPSTNANLPQDAEDYEKATRYNYTSQEKFAMIEVIAMIKTIQNQLKRLEFQFNDTIIPYIFYELQEFLYLTVPKIEKKISSKQMTLIRFVKSLAEVALYKYDENRSTIRTKKVPPRSTQLYLIRCIVENLIHNHSGPLKGTPIKLLDELHKKSFYWSYMLNFEETLDICCDLSQMWYREFFLEMTNGKKIQFAIETSIPCILTNHILDTQDPAYLEYLLYPLDLYNDSAICALKKFHRQFLYNEIEAEVNFVMIQLVVRLSDQIYLCFKQISSYQLLNKRFQNNVQIFGQNIIGQIPIERYLTLMKQRHLLLLGRSFNLSKLIAQRINKSVYESLDIVVKRFKRNGLTNIMEFDCLIEVNRLTHSCLSQYLNLDNFDSMLTEIIQSTSSTFGSLTAFIIKEINLVICENFSYNSSTDRFYPLKEIFRDIPTETVHDRPEHLWGSRILNMCFESQLKFFSGYFGKEHFIKMYQLIGYDGVFWLVAEIINLTEQMLSTELRDIVNNLMDLIPEGISQRLDGKNCNEQIQIILEELKQLLAIKKVVPDAAQCFHRLGNFVLFLLKLENNMFINEGLENKQAFPFVGIFPMYDSKDETERKRIETKYQVFNITHMMDQFASRQKFELAKQQTALTKERLCQANSLFKNFLIRIKHILFNTFVMNDNEDDDGDHQNASNQINFWTRIPHNLPQSSNANDDRAFFSIWSAFIFIFVAQKNASGSIQYGEELYWSGCTLISLLNQQIIYDRQNICEKMMRAYKFTKKDQKIENELDAIIVRIKRIVQIHTNAFQVFNRYMLIKDDYAHLAERFVHFNVNEINGKSNQIVANTVYDDDDGEFEESDEDF